MTGDALHRHAVGAQLDHAGLAQVGGHVRRQIAGGIVDFVQQLFLGRAGIDHAAGAVGLADDELPIGLDLGDGEAGWCRSGTSFKPGTLK